MSFFAELKRRNVYKVAVAYAVVGWLLVEVTTQVFPIFEIPNWALRLIVLAIIVGFPIALVIAWAFELTPEGIKRTEDVDLTMPTRAKSPTWIYVVIVGALLSVGLFYFGRYTAPAERRAVLQKNQSRSCRSKIKTTTRTRTTCATAFPKASSTAFPSSLSSR